MHMVQNRNLITFLKQPSFFLSLDSIRRQWVPVLKWQYILDDGTGNLSKRRCGPHQHHQSGGAGVYQYTHVIRLVSVQSTEKQTIYWWVGKSIWAACWSYSQDVKESVDQQKVCSQLKLELPRIWRIRICSQPGSKIRNPDSLKRYVCKI